MFKAHIENLAMLTPSGSPACRSASRWPVLFGFGSRCLRSGAPRTTFFALALILVANALIALLTLLLILIIRTSVFCRITPLV
jgi:hypothetical protein